MTITTTRTTTMMRMTTTEATADRAVREIAGRSRGGDFMIRTHNRRRAAGVCLAGMLAFCTACTPAPVPGGGGGTGGEVPDDLPDTVPAFDAATFTQPTQIDNAFLPLVPGTTLTYRVETDEGTETIVVEVLDDTREVQGVSCRVVRDRVYLDGLLIEDTHDWFAQDDEGNVWYMGEEVDNYNYDDEDNLIDITHEGAWEAGRDVAGAGTIARPGYQMPASPAPGITYHQEYYEGEAEDMAEVVALDVPVTLADGTEYSCLQTRDINPLEPGAEEFKYYASGIGLVLEETPDGEERAELVSVEP
jgi:hypothetical protein